MNPRVPGLWAAVVATLRRRAAPLTVSAFVAGWAVASGTHTPAWMLTVMWAVNITIAVCYSIIPDFLERENWHGETGAELGVYIRPADATAFARFISACGMHHEITHAAMMLMMAGVLVHGTAGTWMLWAGFVAAVAVDGWTAWVSYQAAESFRRSKGLA